MIYLDGEALKRLFIKYQLTNRDFFHQYNDLRNSQLAEFPRARLLDEPAISTFINSKPQSPGRRANTHTAAVMAAVFNLPNNYFVVPKQILIEDNREEESPILHPDSRKIQTEITSIEKSSAVRDLPVTNQIFVELPYVSVQARIGFVESGAQTASYHIHDTRRMYLRGDLPETYSKRIIFEVADDSMEPYINRGDEIIAVEILKMKWDVLQNGVFVVCFGGDMLTIKKIVNNDLAKNDTLMLRPWRDELAPLTIRRNEIHAIFRVEKVLPHAFSVRL